jgi:Pyruvate/2-oxoacid:ferredoxin oxidoreductase gamma subunit
VTTATASIVPLINEYAVIIGLGLSLFSIMIGIFFHIYGVRLKQRQFKARMQADREAIRKEIIEEIAQENIKVINIDKQG